MNDFESKKRLLENDIKHLSRQIEITEGYSPHDHNLTFLYYQLRTLKKELENLKEVDKDEIYKRNGR